MPSVGSDTAEKPRPAPAAPADAIFKNSRREFVIDSPQDSLPDRAQSLLCERSGGHEFLRALRHHLGEVKAAIRRHCDAVGPVQFTWLIAFRDDPELLQAAFSIEL